MKIANQLPQNSKEWLEWRKSGLGASDAPAIMKVSPYTSYFELWLEKTGIAERPDFHPMAIRAMARGTLLEPEARACYEKKVGHKFEVINVIHEKHSFIRASLDGYNAEHNRIVEIKCPGKVDLEEARKGRVPKKYLPQVQLQLLVTGAVACDYFTYDGKDGIIVEVLPDKAYHKKLEDEMVLFWTLVDSRIAPEVTLKDIEAAQKANDVVLAKLKKAGETLNFVLQTFAEQTKQGDK